MPTVEQLLAKLEKTKETVLLASHDEPIETAMNRMYQRKYSQLPVSKDGKHYLVTLESILGLLGQFGAKVNSKGLRVGDALLTVSKVFGIQDDLFELMNSVERDGAALVIGESGQIINIVTTFDTNDYFQQWSEDTMHVRDIESQLKVFITAAFKRSDGSIDLEARRTAVTSITSPGAPLRRKFEAAVRHYLREQAASTVVPGSPFIEFAMLEFLRDAEGAPDPEVSTSAIVTTPVITLTDRQALRKAGQLILDKLKSAIAIYLTRQASSELTPNARFLDSAFNAAMLDATETRKQFDELSLNQYIHMFFEFCWSRCSSVIGIEKESLEFMLTGVRDTRNKLAHFHEDEVTPQAQLQLKRCNEWLQNAKRQILLALEASVPEELIVRGEIPETASSEATALGVALPTTPEISSSQPSVGGNGGC